MARRLSILVLTLLVCGIGRAQVPDPFVTSVINQVSLDSLVLTVRQLSGDTTALVGGSAVRITSREAASAGNAVAAQYIKERLGSYGLVASDHAYSATGKNIIAVQQGNEFPFIQYIICGHYDSKPSGPSAPGADDNASGTATVIEAARVLSGRQLRYTVVYALWDEEENGLIGSTQYATSAANGRDSILGVINIDMIGWDGNGDSLLEVHTRSAARSLALADTILYADRVYGTAVNPAKKNPGTTASDHAPFWNRGYSAVLLIEGYQSGDFNPYYHSVRDSIRHFRLPYFLNSARLAIGSLAMLAGAGSASGVLADAAVPVRTRLLQNYPNPFNPTTAIRYEVAERTRVTLAVYDVLGDIRATLADNDHQPGAYVATFDASRLPSGVYFCRLQAGTRAETKRMLLVR